MEQLACQAATSHTTKSIVNLFNILNHNLLNNVKLLKINFPGVIFVSATKPIAHDMKISTGIILPCLLALTIFSGCTNRDQATKTDPLTNTEEFK